MFDAYNAHDPGALRRLYAPAASTRGPGWPTDGGIAEMVASAEMDVIVFPNLRIEPLLSMGEGGTLCTEVRITGTDTGEIAPGDFGRQPKPPPVCLPPLASP